MAKEKQFTVTYEGNQEQAVQTGYKIKAEDWNEYELADGTTLRLKTVVTGVARLLMKYRADGEPIYLVKSTNIVESEALKNLLFKPSDRSKAN